jgi:ABC-type transporter Mla MlaB component
VTIQQQEGKQVTLKIEGNIEGLPVAELYRAWQELAPTLGERRLHVDIRGVTRINETGRQLLAEIHARTQAEFIADTPLTKYFAEQAQQSIRTKSDPNGSSRRTS